MNTIPSALILGGTVSVDTFFMMSGLLLAYLYFSAMNKGVKFNLILFYLRRYVRVSAPLVIVVLFYSHLLEFLGAGPVWTRTMHGLRDPCQEYWWSTMLHIQNYINPTKFVSIKFKNFGDKICFLLSYWFVTIDLKLLICLFSILFILFFSALFRLGT